MQIESRVFLVTGAGSGLGAAVARRLVADGGRVVVVDVNPAAGEATAAELGEAAHFVKTDVTCEADGRAAAMRSRNSSTIADAAGRRATAAAIEGKVLVQSSPLRVRSVTLPRSSRAWRR